MKLYAPHQLRVIDEFDELEEKRIKLQAFLNSDQFKVVVTDEEEQRRLLRQWMAMTNYSDILAERIANF